MHLKLLIDVVGMVVGIVVKNWAELNSRGRPSYRGSAAQNSVEKKVMAWS